MTYAVTDALRKRWKRDREGLPSIPAASGVQGAKVVPAPKEEEVMNAHEFVAMHFPGSADQDVHKDVMERIIQAALAHFEEHNPRGKDTMARFVAQGMLENVQRMV